MSGAVKGAAARIREQCPKAHFIHCAAHRLNLCRTRWVERHNAFEVFVNLYKPLITCFETIATETSNWNRETRQDANSLLHSLLRFPMLVALIITREILLITKGLSIKTYVDIV